MILVVDASVAVKLFSAEPGHDAARQAVRDHDAIAPNFARIEIANVLWKKLKRGEIDHSQVFDALTVLNHGLLEFVDDDPHWAARLAADIDHPVYDCIYLACALARDIPLLTDDRKLTDKAQTAGVTTFRLGEPID